MKIFLLILLLLLVLFDIVFVMCALKISGEESRREENQNIKFNADPDNKEAMLRK